MYKIKILKDVGLLGSWFHLSKFINLFTFFIIAKFLSPNEFGLLNLSFTILFFLMIVPQAIFGAVIKFVSEDKNKFFFIKGLKLSIFVGFLISVLIFLLSNSIAQIFSQNISSYIKIISLVFFVSCVYEIFKGVFLSLKKTSYFIIVEFVYYSSNLISVILLFLWNFGIFAPLYSLLISTIFALIICFILFKNIKFTKYYVVDNVKFLSFTYKSILIPILAQSIVFVFVFFLSNYRPPEELGYYYFLSKITIFLLAIFPLALDRVFMPYFSEYYTKKNVVKLKEISWFYLKIIFFYLLISSTLLYFILKIVISLFFKEYISTIYYLPLFLILGSLLAFNTLPNTILVAINKLRIIILILSLSLIIAILCSYYLIPEFGLISLGIIHSILSLLGTISYFIFIKYKVLNK